MFDYYWRPVSLFMLLKNQLLLLKGLATGIGAKNAENQTCFFLLFAQKLRSQTKFRFLASIKKVIKKLMVYIANYRKQMVGRTMILKSSKIISSFFCILDIFLKPCHFWHGLTRFTGKALLHGNAWRIKFDGKLVNNFAKIQKHFINFDLILHWTYISDTFFAILSWSFDVR